jgi:hypothetical protein
MKYILGKLFDWLMKVAECLEGRKKGDPEKIFVSNLD